MIGGLKISRLALLAATGLFVGGVASAQAADLGGDCCADLEERVAELEATTARKGNRKVKLTVSGHINETLLGWDDGHESNVYVASNSVAKTRFRFLGEAKISSDWSAGYLLEMQANSNQTESLNANNDDNGGAVSVRHSAWWIKSNQLGKLWVGQTSQSTDGITEINLANTGHFANQSGGVAYIGSFNARTAAGGFGSTMGTLFGGGSGTDSAQIGEGNRRNLVKYETPTILGFIASASAGEDDFWDVALRYAGEHSGFKLAFGIGYEQSTELISNNERGCVGVVAADPSSDVKCSQLGVSGAVMHVATGLFVHGSYGIRWDDHAAKAAGTTNLRDTAESYYIQAGIEQNWFGIGKSTLFGEYQHWSSGQTAAKNTNSDVTMWGVGFNQAIDAAAMDLYVKYNNYQDISETTNAGVKTDFKDFQTLVAGGIIRF